MKKSAIQKPTKTTHNDRMDLSINELIQDTAKSLYEAELIDSTTMREFETLNIEPVKKYSPAQIKKLRFHCKVSQHVMAKLLNVSQSAIKQWESGERKPTGSALKLLNLIEKKGIKAVI